MGAPRRYCYECAPDWSVGESPGLRKARAEAKRRRRLAERLAIVLQGRLEWLETDPPRRWVCGCGRDYLTVPLGEEMCPSPIYLD